MSSCPCNRPVQIPALYGVAQYGKFSPKKIIRSLRRKVKRLDDETDFINRGKKYIEKRARRLLDERM